MNIYLGTVINDKPLTIDGAGVLLDADQLLLCGALKKEHKRKITLNKIKAIPDVTTFEADEELRENILQKGDEVLLLALDGGQQFVVIDKVVSA